MIEYIDNRLKEWARYVGGSNTGGLASGLWSLIFSGGSAEATGAERVLMSPDAEEIEAAVIALSEDILKQTIFQQYLSQGNSTACAKALHVSRKKYYDLLDMAHIEIDRYLHR